MSWFYEAMREYEMEFDFKPCRPWSSMTEEQGVDLTIKNFEAHIEKAFYDWTIYRVFNHNRCDLNYDDYEEHDVWGFLRDVAIDYSREHTYVVIIGSDEGEGEDE